MSIHAIHQLPDAFKHVAILYQNITKTKLLNQMYSTPDLDTETITRLIQPNQDQATTKAIIISDHKAEDNSTYGPKDYEKIVQKI